MQINKLTTPLLGEDAPLRICHRNFTDGIHECSCSQIDAAIFLHYSQLLICRDHGFFQSGIHELFFTRSFDCAQSLRVAEFLSREHLDRLHDPLVSPLLEPLLHPAKSHVRKIFDPLEV